MEEKELRKLNRVQILELFLEQCRRNEELEKELEKTKKELESKNIKIASSGSIAEASLALTKVFEEAQKAADLYLSNIKGEAETNSGEESEEDSSEHTAEEIQDEEAEGIEEDAAEADGNDSIDAKVTSDVAGVEPDDSEK